MNGLKQKGITLIALVVTIVVLLILAGVSINLLLGDNGIITRAKGAKDDYSKSAVKEKISLLLSEYTIDKEIGENKDLAKFLRQNLQVGVAEKEDGSYSFMLGDWQVVTSEREIISIEKFKLDINKTYSSVTDMKDDTSLVAGKIVKTEGYYNKDLGGGAYYDIVSTTSLNADNATCIKLDNGLYAKLHVINSTVSVNQFGAYGDGEHDDAGAIQLALNSGYKNISFENKKYKFSETIYLITSNVHILGNGATLFWDEQQIVPWEQFKIAGTGSHGIQNVTINFLNFENGNVTVIDNPGQSIQLSGIYCNNIEISNCNFNINKIADNKKRKITNLWFYTSFDNIKIENNNFINLSDSLAGGNIWIKGDNENTSKESQNIVIRNNYIEKSSHDESIAVWDGNINRVKIENNRIYLHEEDVENQSDMNFTLGSKNGIIKNVEFRDNTINAESKLCLAVCDGKEESGNINIYNNDIKWKKIEGVQSYYSFIQNQMTLNINISNNKIEYCENSKDTDGIGRLVCENENYKENKITINGKLDSLKYVNNGKNDDSIFQKNNVTINTKLLFLYQGYDFCENNITMNNGLGNPTKAGPAIFGYYGNNISSDIKIKNNTIIIKNTNEWQDNYIQMLNFYNGYINDHMIIIADNSIKTDSNTTVQNLINLVKINDEKRQKINFENNNYGIFKQIRFSNNNAGPIVIVDGKEISNMTILN